MPSKMQYNGLFGFCLAHIGPTYRYIRMYIRKCLDFRRLQSDLSSYGDEPSDNLKTQIQCLSPVKTMKPHS